MAAITNNKGRIVIPNWRDYKTTIELRELDVNNPNTFNGVFYPIDDYIKAWEENRMIPYAADLISAAIMNNQKDNISVIQAARFVAERKEEVPTPLYNTAQSILFTAPIKSGNAVSLSISERLDNLDNEESKLQERVRFIRKLTYKFPYNPIWYTELSLAYAKLGLLNKAEYAMNIALHLAPESRFVTRSAARFFLHLNKLDKAHRILVVNPSIKVDPWILASEISINASRGRNSRFLKCGISMIESSNFSPFSLTELASAIGTIEHNYSQKKCKKYINKALISPNDNSLSQAEWLMSIDNSLKFIFHNDSMIKNKHEAEARHAFLQEDYLNALDASVKWLEEMPYSKTAISFASEIAYLYQKDYKNAIKILEIGLKSNREDLGMLNNLAYSYALEGNTQKADEKLKKADKMLNKKVCINKKEQIEKICLTATKGLNEYRKGNIEEGRRYYMESMNIAQHSKSNQQILDKAKLNFIREELRATNSCDENLLNSMDKLDTGIFRETNIMKQEIKQLLLTKVSRPLKRDGKL